MRGASQEAIWAPVSSPVSRPLNPVSIGTKREEAQPPTADISNSLYNATRGRMSPPRDDYPALPCCSLSLLRNPISSKQKLSIVAHSNPRVSNKPLFCSPGSVNSLKCYKYS